jgi:hypothetical protein
MLAVERAGLEPDNLSYDAARRAVGAWREERE